MDWQPRARALARTVTDTHSRWHLPLAATPRHVFVPRWWEGDRLADGPADEKAWAEAAYSDQTLVTSVGGLHADHAGPEDRPCGRPTSSSTLPSLVVRMYRHARLYDARTSSTSAPDQGTGAHCWPPGSATLPLPASTSMRTCRRWPGGGWPASACTRAW